MKTSRINFEKGINNVGDKALMPDGYATILDNVDLRSGSPRPFRAPEYRFGTPDGTTRSWSYRGKWHHSPNWRDYIGEYIGGIERVYYTEEGVLPWKEIEGHSAQLGTPRPKVPLAVSAASSVTPSRVTVDVSEGYGTIQDGEHYYAVSAKTAEGVLDASQIVKMVLPKIDIIAGQTSYGSYNYAKAVGVSVLVPDVGVGATIGSAAITGALFGSSHPVKIAVPQYLRYAVDIAWQPVDGAIGYIIWKGDANNQYSLAEVDASILEYRDDGNKLANGALLQSVVSSQKLQYSYTYVRKVGGVTDESGMSYPSQPLLGENGRLLTRDFLNDGYLSGTGVLTGTALANMSSIDFPLISLLGGTATYDFQLSQTKFVVTGHGLATDDKVLFPSTMVDTVYKGTQQKVVKIDANAFAIKNRNVPTDANLFTATISPFAIQPVKAKFSHASLNVSSLDAMYITHTGTTQSVADTYNATVLDTTHFSVPLILTETISAPGASLHWRAGNGNYDTWNIYRNEEGGWFLVKSVAMTESTYTDYKPFSALGDTPTSYYSENGQVVDYEPPPVGMVGIESHYGMKFAISGRQVRWTPILQPDAWPSTFSITFAYQPVALASFAQGLIVLCEDAIYRIDGNQPTGMSMSKTRSEDGCIAPHSVQKTQQGLIYLSKRGLMLFNGIDAQCITDTKLPSTALTGPSRLANPVPFWWIPTLMTKNYADMCGEFGVIGNQYAFNMDNTEVISGVNKSVKSFYNLGKYFLFYTGDDYDGNTAICIDLQLPGFPITTLGVKALDAHVDEFEQSFLLLSGTPPTTTVTITYPY